MRHIFFYCLTLTVLWGCKKETNSKVEIYMLKSFTATIDRTTNLATVSILNAVLADTPFIADADIEFYTKSTTTFKLKKDIKSIIKNYGADKAFAVTVNNHAVYFGVFHPAYLSSIAFGVATIDPILFSDNELKIQFATIDGNSYLLQLDKRNDSRITNSLKASRRLR